MIEYVLTVIPSGRLGAGSLSYPIRIPPTVASNAMQKAPASHSPVHLSWACLLHHRCIRGPAALGAGTVDTEFVGELAGDEAEVLDLLNGDGVLGAVG